MLDEIFAMSYYYRMKRSLPCFGIQRYLLLM